MKFSSSPEVASADMLLAGETLGELGDCMGDV